MWQGAKALVDGEENRGGEHKNLGLTLLPLSHLLPILPIDQTQPETERQDGAASLGTE